MGRRYYDELSRRERQVMDVVLRRGGATVAEVTAALPDPPSYSAVRAGLNELERKGVLRHTRRGASYVYAAVPAVASPSAGRRALRRVVDTLFRGSREAALAALLDAREGVGADELRRLRELIDRAAEEGR